MSTPIEYSRVVQELDTVIDDRDDALRQVAAARTQLATVRAAIEALCVESEQVRRSSRVLPGVEPMVYVSDLRALLADDGAAALREVKAAAYDQGWKARDPHARDHGNPYRDTAGEAGDGD